ncbi:MAG: DUF3179 domain-containing protein, partial [Gammaproteobacteria bacterium]|nr:DUF3179 domain-containing protein [Gammaproteobacteria bacterium]
MATAFSRGLNGETRSVELKDGIFTDAETGSHWDLLPRAVAGRLQGQKRAPLESGIYFTLAWLAFNPDTEILSARLNRL